MANEKRLIKVCDATAVYNGIALYMAENAYLNDTALDVLEMVEKWLDEAPTVDAVELPCKLGDRVWAIRNFRGVLVPQEGIVSEMFFCGDMRLCIVVKHIARGEWGKTVFATKEETEAQIAKMDGGNEDENS